MIAHFRDGSDLLLVMEYIPGEDLEVMLVPQFHHSQSTFRLTGER